MILLTFNGKIKGDSTKDKHIDWIRIRSIQQQVDRTVTFGYSSSTEPAIKSLNAPKFSEVILTKSVDIASVPLWGQAVRAGDLGLATIHFLEVASDQMKVYLEYELKDPIITSFKSSCDDEGRPVEEFAINFTAFKMQFTPYSNDGKPRGKLDAEFDLSYENS